MNNLYSLRGSLNGLQVLAKPARNIGTPFSYPHITRSLHHLALKLPVRVLPPLNWSS